MAPIRVAFIGLSATGSWGTASHLPYLVDTTKYKITALLNSTADSARAAIAAHKLDPDTKAYGSAVDLAADPDIDFVVCSVRVDKHFALLRPVLQSSKSIKAVFCEWPLGSNLAEAEELTALAKSRGVKTLIGLQGRRSPLLSKVKELIETGRIGEVLSVNITATTAFFGAQTLPEFAYVQDSKTGGNMVSIFFAHYFDLVNQAVGQLESFSSILATKRPTIDLRDKPFDYKPGPNDPPVKIVGTIPRDIHDHILIQGRLTSGALLSYHLRGGSEVPGTPGTVWSIYGSKGEIRVTTPGATIHIGTPEDTLQVHDHKTGEVETLSTDAGDEFDQKEYSRSVRNIARLYESFAEGKEHEYADWDEAIVRHRLVDELYRREKEGSGLLPAQYLSDNYGNSLEL